MTENTTPAPHTGAGIPQNTKSTWLPGITVVFIIALISWSLSQFIPNLGSVTIAILLGILVGNILQAPQRLAPGILIAEKRLLPLAIALLGVELQLTTLVDLGLQAALVILLSIGVALITAVYVGRLFGYDPKFSLLMGAGNGICGSSAVAATSTAIQADGRDIGISISVVNLLGTVGIFLMPLMIHTLSLSDLQGGILIGGTLQAVGQVVAAGFAINETTGSIATVVKMGRVLMLGPVVILLTTLMQSTNPQIKTRSKIRIPTFIVGFFILSLLASFNLLPASWVTIIKTSGKFMLVIAMVAIGMRIQLQTLYRFAPRALLFGIIISVSQVLATLLLILLFSL